MSYKPSLFTPDIKLNTFPLTFHTLFGTKNRAYGSSVVLQLPPHLLTLTVIVQKRVSSEFISTSIDLVWHGLLFPDTYFVVTLESEAIVKSSYSKIA